MQRIKILDSCRGLAALTVVFHHLYTRFQNLFIGKGPVWFQQLLQLISDLNVQAVLFFFFLSGFSICLSVRNGLPVTKRSFNEYVYRRLKRILPPYYFAIVFTFFCGLLINAITANDDFNLKTLLGNIFFLQSSKSYKGNWFAPYGDNGPLWSLSFEMFYYFLLPVFLLLVFKCCKTNNLTAINRIALIASFAISVICVLLNKFLFFPYVAFAALFFVWYAGYFVANVYLQKNLALDKNFFLVVLITIVLFVMNYVSSSATLNKLLFGGVIASVFFILYFLRKKLPGQLLTNIESGFNFLFYAAGTGSYALYLLHYPLLMVLRRYEYLTLWQLLAAVILFTIFCIWLERFLVRRKWLFLRLQFIK